MTQRTASVSERCEKRRDGSFMQISPLKNISISKASGIYDQYNGAQLFIASMIFEIYFYVTRFI